MKNRFKNSRRPGSKEKRRMKEGKKKQRRRVRRMMMCRRGEKVHKWKRKWRERKEKKKSL